MPSGFIVYCKVNRILYDFIVSTNNNSDLLILKKGSLLSKVVIANLVKSETFIKPPDQPCIRIQLNHSDAKDVNFYNQITSEGQRNIEIFMMKDLKNRFHTFVAAYYLASGRQRKGIKAFCSMFNISVDLLGFDMLLKSWERSNEKKSVKKNQRFCPYK